MRDLVEHSSKWHVCPVEQPGRSSGAGREVSGQYPAMLHCTKYLFLNKASIFHGHASLFVLAHPRGCRGQRAPRPISLQSGREPCAGIDVKYVTFSLQLLGENKKPPHSTCTKRQQRLSLCGLSRRRGAVPVSPPSPVAMGQQSHG